MKAKLISREHGDFAFTRQATIGRSEGSTVRLDATVVSNEHARISFDPERSAYILEDLGSLNGTQLDGVRIERKELLGKMHLIRFGGSEDFIFQLLNLEEDSEFDTMDIPPAGKSQVGGEVPVLEVRMEASADPATGNATESAFALEFMLEDGSPRFALREGENVVGRSETADIRLDFRDLSRRHATVTVSEEKVLARDEGSRNHTFVNGEQIGEDVVVPVGAQIVFGRLEARLVAAPKGEAPKGNS